MDAFNQKNRIYAITAPSGTGKTTLNRRITEELSDLIELSVSVTTREKRSGEQNGDHYWFVSKDEFEQQILTQEMLEWAAVHGNLYGTTYGELKRIYDKNKKVLLEIDVQGWFQVRAKLSHAVSVFILPPSIQMLWSRLTARGTDSLRTCYLRICNAKKELEQAASYQYFIINDELDRAFEELKSIICEKPSLYLTQEEGVAFCTTLLDEFNHSQWLREIEKQISRN